MGGTDVVAVQCSPAMGRDTSAAQPQTRLTVSLPQGAAGSYSIHASATTAAAAAGSSGSAPIKAWRPRVQQQQGGATTTVDVATEVVPPPPPPARTPASQGGGELQQLASEIRRREQSFNGLLAELEAIQQRCAKLTADGGQAAPGAAAEVAARQETRRGAKHTTHGFGGQQAAGGAAGAALPATTSSPQRRGSSGGAGGSQGEWTWEGLQALEDRIREQHHKVGGVARRERRSWLHTHSGCACEGVLTTALRPPLLQLVEQGVLPPQYFRG